MKYKGWRIKSHENKSERRSRNKIEFITNATILINGITEDYSFRGDTLKESRQKAREFIDKLDLPINNERAKVKS